MDFIGKWKIQSIGTYTDDGEFVYLTAEGYPDSPMLYIDESGYFTFMNYRFIKE